MGRYITKLFILGAFLFLGMTNIFAAGGNLDTGFNGSGKSVFNIEDASAPGSFADVVVLAGNKFLVTGSIVTSGEYNAVTLSRFNADGSPDLSFGTGGKVITDTGITSEAKALAVQPDGKIVVIATSGPYPDHAIVIRYTADGALDTSFGTNGIFFSALELPRDIAVTADDKIYIIGNSGTFPSPNPGLQLARLNANGTADTSFGNNGIASTSGFFGIYADQMAIQPDGKIVISAKSGRNIPTGLIFRFNTNGSLDSGFGTAGTRELEGVNSGSIFMGGGVAIQPDGKIVLAGYARTSGQGFGDSSLMLARLNPDGSSDPSFSGGGIIYHDLSSTWDRATDIVIQDDGKILLSGTRSDSSAFAARFDSTGAFDATFGTGGVVLLPSADKATAIALQGSDIVVVGDDGSDIHVLARLAPTGMILSSTNESFLIGRTDFAHDVAIQSDGKIITVGSSTSPAGITVIAVARLLLNGNLDPAFGTGGQVIFHDGNNLSQAFAVKIQPDGKIVVVGRFAQFSWSFPSLYVIRLNADGSPDNTFGTGGKAIINYTAGTGLIGNDLEFQPDVKIVIGGAHLRQGNEGTYEIDMMAARLNPNGTLDGGFANGGIFTHPTGNGFGPIEQAMALSIQPDGKIILAGTHLMRLALNGAIDAGFPILAPVDFPATDMQLQSDGKMVLSGTKNTDLAIARYNSNASIDTSFGINGVATLDFGGADDMANALYLDPNGDVVAGGATLGGSPSRRKFAIARFKPNGLPDSGFGIGGKVITDFGADAEIFGLIRQSDGKVVAAGSAKVSIDRDYALVRYLSRSAQIDFDGDAKPIFPFTVHKQANGGLTAVRPGATGAAQFGNSSDRIVPADYTGDGLTDVAVWREATGEWFILRSEDNSYFSFPFGTVGDVPAPADYDGDGKADTAVFRPSSGTWFILNSGGGISIVNFGSSGDKPVAADFDGDGKADLAIFRPSDGTWWYRQSSDSQVKVYLFGVSTDKPVVADYTGDGRADIAVWRPSTGEWFVLRSEDSSYYSFPFGLTGDVPVPGDYDGDGKSDAAVFRPSNAVWYLRRSTSGFIAVRFGVNGDSPVPSAFVR